jgi:type I restriction enzyme S subunit
MSTHCHRSWSNGKLQDLVFFQRGFDITKAEQKEGDIPVISSSGVTSYHNEAKVGGPGIIIGRKGSLGTVHYSEGPYWPHDTTLWSKDIKGNNPRYIYYFLKTLGLERFDVGNSNPTLNRNHIHDMVIKIPAKDIQQNIVEILTPYNDLIENNRRRIQLLEEAARLLYQEWFVRLRFPGHEHTKIVDGVPEGWESLPLIEALELQRGFDLPLKNIEPGDVPVYGSTGIIAYHNVSKAKGPGIVTGRSGSLGVVQFVLNDYWPHNTALWVKSLKKVTPLFALQLLRNLKLEQYNGGVSVPTLDRKVVHRIQIIIPPPKIMNDFESVSSDSYALMMNLSQQNTNLIKARDLLLPRLMNGVIPV